MGILMLAGPSLSQIIARLITLVIAFSVHEFAHAWVANELGDSTPRYYGRLTLNPRVHIDIFGAIMVLLAGFGWAKPTPVNPYNLRHGPRAGMAIVSVAGPLSNLALAFIAAIPFKLGLISPLIKPSLLPSPAELLFTFLWLNVILACFNLLPIAPLDGFSILKGLLPTNTADMLARTERFGPLVLMALILLGDRLPILSWVMGPPISALMRLLIT
jgi:Zn-dependent protease